MNMGWMCRIWYPAMDKDYSDPKTVEFALKEWGDVFRRLPRADAVFVPGGDPGHTQPKYLMACCWKADGESAQVSSEGADVGFSAEFIGAWLDEFYRDSGKTSRRG